MILLLLLSLLLNVFCLGRIGYLSDRVNELDAGIDVRVHNILNNTMAKYDSTGGFRTIEERVQDLEKSVLILADKLAEEKQNDY